MRLSRKPPANPNDPAQGAVNPPHRHVASEQIWVALEGNGMLLLDDERIEPFSAGDVVSELADK
jgi:quercetin dioxygenase-like cupin family protein